MNKLLDITICGIGPGNPDLILPWVHQKVATADLLMGGQRHLDIFSSINKRTAVLDGKLAKLEQTILNHADQKIVLLVSGDTGFYSLRSFIKRTFPEAQVELIPGISTFQYFYARLGLGYEKAFLTSLHGTQSDFIFRVSQYESVFLLTDKVHHPIAIAQLLVDAGFENTVMYIGNLLSYPDESIVKSTAKELSLSAQNFDLCAVILINPNHEG